MSATDPALESVLGRLQQATQDISKLPSICGCAGIAIGVMHHGSVVYTHAFGYRDVEQQLSPNVDTIFMIGSVSKTFLSAAIGVAVQDGKMDMDKSLSLYLPDLNPTDNHWSTKLCFTEGT